MVFAHREERWRLESSAPPGPAAISPEGEVVEALDGILELPDGHVLAWPEDQVGDSVKVDDAPWQLLWPPHFELAPSTQSAPRPEELALEMLVDPRDEEVRAAVLVIDGARHELVVRKHLALLLTLAQQRVHDVEQGFHEDDQGWIPTTALCRQVPVPAHLLAMHVHRVRRQLGEAGIQDADRIVESRGRRPHRALRLAPRLKWIRIERWRKSS